jgi:ribose 5-phosphate isomerase B
VRIAVSSDERTGLVDAVLDELAKRGHEVEYLGPERGGQADWPAVSAAAARKVANGGADEAIVMCWTGTGASIAANKIAGVRAALCADAETARGARTWNHANVLAISLRATSEAVAREILDAWFATPYGDDDWNRAQIASIVELEREQHGALTKSLPEGEGI